MLSLVKFIMNFLSCVNDYIYIEDMMTFTALAKIYSTKYFCSTKISGLGEIFVKRKFSRIRYIHDICKHPELDVHEIHIIVSVLSSFQ